MKLIPSDLAVEAAGVIAEMLHGQAGDRLDEAYFTADYGPLWTALTKGDWHLLGTSEEAGGAAFDLVDLVAIGQVWGQHLVPVPYLPTLLVHRWAGPVLADYGESALTYLLPARDGAWSPYLASSDRVVLDAATGATVAGADVSVIEAAPASPRRVQSERGLSSRWCPSLPLARASEYTANLPAEAHHEVAILAAAELSGLAGAVLRIAAEYARDRDQFGQPIMDYQAVSHLLADLRLSVEVAHSAVVWAANEPNRSAGAIRLAWDSSKRATEICVQILGGFGFTWESGLHYYQRHVWAAGELLTSCGVRLWP